MPGRRLLRNLTLPEGDRFVDAVSFLPPRAGADSIFSRDFLAATGKFAAVAGAFRKMYDDAPAKDPLSRLLYLDSKSNLPGDILTKVDRMSMAASLEMRAPLLDHELAEWAAGLESRWKVRAGQGKYLLRKLALRIGVPRSVLERPKQGFTLPLGDWLRGELKDEVPRLLLEPRSLQRGYVNRRAVERILDEHRRARRDHSGAIWLLLMFELWHRNFLEQAGRGYFAPAALHLTDPSSTVAGATVAPAAATPSERPI
jgi:asparagine synthase (glutamine-hydrolysing)